MITLEGWKVEKIGQSLFADRGEIENGMLWKSAGKWHFSPALRSMLRKIGLGGSGEWWCEYDHGLGVFKINRVHYMVTK